MAIDWTTIRPVMIELFSKLSGLQTLWVGKRRPYMDPKAQGFLLLRVREDEEIGIADRRYTDLGLPIPEATLEETRNGFDRVSFDMRVESLRHDDDRFAFNTLSKVRSDLFFAANLAVLRAVNVAVIRAGKTVDVPDRLTDQRITSIAILELQTTIAFCSANSGEANHVYNIESVENPFDHPDTEFFPP